MLTGHPFDLCESGEPSELLLEDSVSEIDEDVEVPQKILYAASFKELARSHVHCDTIIWVMISLLLVLAWGLGLIMLLYLPVRRYVLQKDISSRKLYVTPTEIVYKVSRPSFLPFLGYTKIEKHIPLTLVISIIVEQGCLQTLYGIHTLRIESIAHGKASPVDELQVQAVSNPELLRKVIITEAARSIREAGSWKTKMSFSDVVATPTRMRSQTEVLPVSIMQSPSRKVAASPRRALFGFGPSGGVVPGDLFLNKLEEIKQSVTKLEALVGAQGH